MRRSQVRESPEEQGDSLEARKSKSQSGSDRSVHLEPLTFSQLQLLALLSLPKLLLFCLSATLFSQLGFWLVGWLSDRSICQFPKMPGCPSSRPPCQPHSAPHSLTLKPSEQAFFSCLLIHFLLLGQRLF